MKVSSFYKPCKKSARFDTLAGNYKGAAYGSALSKAYNALKSNIPYDEVLSTLKGDLMMSYDCSWFPFTWMKEQTVADDVNKFARFLKWLGKAEVLDANLEVNAVFENVDLTDNVSLILRFGNMPVAMIVNQGRNRFSFSGKNKHTRADCNLHALIAKHSLEGIYPGICITNVYLTGNGDTPGHIAPAFVIDKTKASNVATLGFKEYYNGSVFSYNMLEKKIVDILVEPMAINCYGCLHGSLCKLKPLKSVTSTIKKEARSYRIPDYTESQMRVVNKINGPMLVCAGPGSGKTATLVGRIRNLLHAGIDSDYILAITFTREAADELRSRVASFCDKDLPHISTINALCYKILRENPALTGGTVQLLSKRDKLSIIEGLLDAFPPIQGLNYSILDGNNGLLRTVERKLDRYLSMECDPVPFLLTQKGLGKEFLDLADAYVHILAKNTILPSRTRSAFALKCFQGILKPCRIIKISTAISW